MTDAPDIGATTLGAFAAVPRVNAWLFSKLASFVRGDVLEVGSGIGNLSGFVRGRAGRLTVTDREPRYLEALARRFAGDPAVRVVAYDLAAPPPPELAGTRFDTIIAMNVFEHLEDDRTLATRLAGLLAPGGALLVYVPACSFAFGALDRALGHQRRYSPAALSSLVSGAGLSLIAPPRYVNLLGLAGWCLHTRVLGRAGLSKWELSLFERMLPLVRLEDRFRLPLGVGLHAVATRR